MTEKIPLFFTQIKENVATHPELGPVDPGPGLELGGQRLQHLVEVVPANHTVVGQRRSEAYPPPLENQNVNIRPARPVPDGVRGELLDVLEGHGGQAHQHIRIQHGLARVLDLHVGRGLGATKRSWLGQSDYGAVRCDERGQVSQHARAPKTFYFPVISPLDLSRNTNYNAPVLRRITDETHLLERGFYPFDVPLERATVTLLHGL